MPLSARRWKQFAESQYPHEREALEFLCEILPDRDPTFLYSNFEFIADDGSVNEVDALVVTQAGIFLVELKSRGGSIKGNRHLWDWDKDGHTITVDSPLTLTNSKARKLAGLLSKQRSFRGERAPWIEALVFLSAPRISVQLADSERMRICEREPRDKKPGITSALLQREYYGNESARGPFLELAVQPPGKFSNLRGVGNRTRREIMDLVGRLRSRLPQSAIPERTLVDLPTDDSTGEAVAPLSIDELTSLLIPVERSASGKVSRQILTEFLELNDDATGAPRYPTQAEVAERTGKARAQVSQVIAKARERWRRSVPQLTPIRSEVAEFIAAEGGVVQISELAQFLLASRGSTVPEPLASRRAAAVLRAALEAEKPSDSCKFKERRNDGTFFVAHRPTEVRDGATVELPFAEQALDYAAAVAEAGHKLAFADPLPSPTRALETLRAIPTLIPGLRDDRLVRIAAAHPKVAVSPRLELYPRHLEALRALKLAQSSLAGIASITADELRSRVQDRYPEAQPLPGPPDLHRLVEQAGLGLQPDPSGTVYVAPSTAGIPSSITLTRYQTIASPGSSLLLPPIEQPRDIEEAIEFERRLRAAYSAPSYLVLATERKLKYLEMALKNIARHFPMEVFHCERAFLAALRIEAESKRIKWDVVLRADASKPAGNGHAVRDWENLRKLAASAARSVADQLRARTQPTLIVYPGLLARYGQLSILDELADSIGQHSLWVLAGSDRQAASPMIDGQAIPARPTQWGWIPGKWLDNEFRKAKGGSAA